MPKLLTAEQETFVRANYKGMGNQELADLINQKFCLSISRGQINTWKKNRTLDSGLNGRFKKGHTPANKGTKGTHNVGGNKTSFKKGQKAFNHRPVGSERVCSKEGYILIKVAEGKPWRLKHNVVWERENGPIPKECAVIFADGDKKNITLENLILISRRQLVHMNINGWIKNDKKLTEIGTTLASMKIAMINKKKVK